MRALGGSGIWELFVPGVGDGARYKFEIRAQSGELLLKADPFAFETELPPQTASIVHALDVRVERRRVPRRARATARRWPSRCRSTRSTSARGG